MTPEREPSQAMHVLQHDVLELAREINEKLRGKREVQPQQHIVQKLFSTNGIKPGEVVELRDELRESTQIDRTALLSEVADITYYLIQLSHYDSSYLRDLEEFQEALGLSDDEIADITKTKYQMRLSEGKDKTAEADAIAAAWQELGGRELSVSPQALVSHLDQLVQERGEKLGNRDLTFWTAEKETVEKLRRSDVLILKSGTGTGKTTQMPQLLDQYGFTREGVIRIEQNRVVIARETAHRVAQEMGTKTGDKVGYLTGSDKNVSRGTDIIFETTGILKRVLQSNPNLEGVSAIMIDEFDERTLDQDIVVSIIKKAKDNGWRGKLILTSATGDLEALRKHFGEDVTEYVEISGQEYDVDTTFATESVSDIYSAIADRVEQLDGQFPPEESILIFLPGEGEIGRAIDATNRKGLGNAQLLPFHGKLDKDEMHQVFAEGDGRRKIIFATDLAQRGLTLGKLHVIDSCLQKRQEYDPQKDCQALVTKTISQSDFQQRRGRAGRVADGTHWPLVTEQEYKDMDVEVPPEILRVPLRSVVLQIKAMGYSREDDPLDFITNPGKTNWKEAKNQLRLLGLLDADDETKLSERGKLVAELPCDPRDGVSLLRAIELGVADDMVAITAMKMARDIFIVPRDKKSEAKAAHERLMKTGSSDNKVCTDCDLINALNVFRMAEQHENDHKWFRDNFISYKSYKAAKSNLRNIETVVGKIEQRLAAAPEIPDDYTRQERIILSVYEGNKDKEFVRRGRNYYQVDGDYDSYRLAFGSDTQGDRIIANESIKLDGGFLLITKATAMPKRFPQVEEELVAEEVDTTPEIKSPADVAEPIRSDIQQVIEHESVEGKVATSDPVIEMGTGATAAIDAVVKPEQPTEEQVTDPESAREEVSVVQDPVESDTTTAIDMDSAAQEFAFLESVDRTWEAIAEAAAEEIENVAQEVAELKSGFLNFDTLQEQQRAAKEELKYVRKQYDRLDKELKPIQNVQAKHQLASKLRSERAGFNAQKNQLEYKIKELGRKMNEVNQVQQRITERGEYLRQVQGLEERAFEAM